VSDALIRIYLLDGSYKTVSFDESTRISDLVKKVGHLVFLKVSLSG
jgi:hypothetical protein